MGLTQENIEKPQKIHKVADLEREEEEEKFNSSFQVSSKAQNFNGSQGVNIRPKVYD